MQQGKDAENNLPKDRLRPMRSTATIRKAGIRFGAAPEGRAMFTRPPNIEMISGCCNAAKQSGWRDWLGNFLNWKQGAYQTSASWSRTQTASHPCLFSGFGKTQEAYW